MAIKSPDISIIIVTYNTRDLTLKCLESVFKETSGMEFEVFLVDNNSNDKTSESVRKNFPSVKIIENKENLGFARANNQALKIAAGRYVLLLNSDTVVLNSAFKQMIEYMDNHSEAGAIGPALLDKNLCLQKSWAKRMTLLSIFLVSWLARATVNYEISRMKGIEYVDVLFGACFMVKREIIDKVGLLDERYFMYSEDLDWSYRIARAGYKLVYYPTAKVIHYGGESGKAENKKLEKELIKNMIIVFKKYNGPVTGFLGALIVYSSVYIRKALKFFSGKT